ncbi:MAG: molybdopterin-dependent oxidoreductase [Nitrospinota bacterium]|nr:molybdopterin-dependent oxidoreductase [Nitrospinota bacterium]
MDRRSFLKLSGVAASAGAVGACSRASQKVIPFVETPNDGANPVDGDWYATTCRECNAGCGIIVRTVNGRVKKIEGNAMHPVSRGKACARGQAAAQTVYHPERLTSPMLKGAGGFEAIGWDKAVDILSQRFTEAEGKLFFLNNGANDAASGIVSAIFGKMDGFVSAGNQEPGFETLRAGGKDLASFPRMPFPDLDHAQFAILFGADIFESGPSPVFWGGAFGECRRGRASVRGRLVYAGPRLSATAAVCDLWLPIPPGRLGVLTLSVAQVVVDIIITRKLASSIPRNALGRWSNALREYEPEKVAAQLEMMPEHIRKLALPFVDESPSVAIAGADVTGHANGVAALDAVEFLNMLSYEIGREKLRIHERLTPEPNDDLKRRIAGALGVDHEAQGFSRLADLVGGMEQGNFSMGIIHHTNPVFDTPSGLKFKEAMAKVGFTVAVSNFMDETAAEATLVLPDHHWLEAWSVQTPDFVPGVPVFNLQQPVIRPFFDTRSGADIILAAATAAKLKTPAATTEAFVKGTIKRFRAEMHGAPVYLDDNAFNRHLLRNGGWWPEQIETEAAPVPSGTVLWEYRDKLKAPEPEFDGAENPFYLHPFQTVHMGRGQGANSGWLQEAPDPITTLMWQFWVEMNPATAAKLGVVEGDMVKISSAHGSITAPVFPYKGIRPDVVAVPIGYGHTNYGKLANGRGENVMTLLGAKRDTVSGALAWRSQKVKVEKAEGRTKMLRNAHPEGEYKGEVFQL